MCHFSEFFLRKVGGILSEFFTREEIYIFIHPGESLLIARRVWIFHASFPGENASYYLPVKLEKVRVINKTCLRYEKLNNFKQPIVWKGSLNPPKNLSKGTRGGNFIERVNKPGPQMSSMNSASLLCGCREKSEKKKTDRGTRQVNKRKPSPGICHMRPGSFFFER